MYGVRFFLYSVNVTKTIPDEALGRTLQAWRQQRGLSQKELRARLTVAGIAWSPTTLSQVEGGTRSIRLNEVPAIASALDVSIEDLLPTLNLLTSALTKARWTEKAAFDTLDDSQWKYEDVRRYRRALQLLHELGDGSESTYRIHASAAHFLDSWLTVGSIDLKTDPASACRAVGISEDAIGTALENATTTARDWSTSGHQLSDLIDHFSPDNTLPFSDEQADSLERDFMSIGVKRSLFHEALGSLLASRFPNVIWQPAPRGTRSASDEIEGIVDAEL